MLSSQPRRKTVRLIVHLPTDPGRRLAHWSLMVVTEGGAVPHGEVLDQGNIPVSSPDPTYEEILTMIDAVVGPHIIS